MAEIFKINNSSYDDIVSNLDKYIEVFLSEGVIAFSKPCVSIAGQINIMNMMAKKLKWGHIPHMNIEDHEYSLKNMHDRNKKDQVFIPWHLEHVMNQNPQIAASWKMVKLSSEKGSGKTGFVHSNDVYELLDEDHKTFLDKCQIIDSEKSFKERPAIRVHKNTGKKIIRIEPNNSEELFSFNGEKPSTETVQKFKEINYFIKQNVHENKEIQKWWEWEENDMLIVDLFSMNHCVKGGFNLGERLFTRVWAFDDDPSKYEYKSFG